MFDLRDIHIRNLRRLSWRLRDRPRNTVQANRTHPGGAPRNSASKQCDTVKKLLLKLRPVVGCSVVNFFVESRESRYHIVPRPDSGKNPKAAAQVQHTDCFLVFSHLSYPEDPQGEANGVVDLRQRNSTPCEWPHVPPSRVRHRRPSSAQAGDCQIFSTIGKA